MSLIKGSEKRFCEIRFKVSTKLWKEIKELAEKEHRTISGWVRAVIEDHVIAENMLKRAEKVGIDTSELRSNNRAKEDTSL